MRTGKMTVHFDQARLGELIGALGRYGVSLISIRRAGAVGTLTQWEFVVYHDALPLEWDQQDCYIVDSDDPTAPAICNQVGSEMAVRCELPPVPAVEVA